MITYASPVGSIVFVFGAVSSTRLMCRIVTDTRSLVSRGHRGIIAVIVRLAFEQQLLFASFHSTPT